MSRKLQSLEYLTHRQMDAVHLFCRGLLASEVAKELGVSESTVRGWLRKPLFQRITQSLIAEAQERHIRRMIGTVEDGTQEKA